MKRGIWGVLALVVASYIGWPYLTLYQLDGAIRDQDEAALDRLVDWDSLSMGLSHDFNGAFDLADEEVGEDDLAANLLGIFSDLLVSPAVAFFASPRGLPYLINSQVLLDDPFEAVQADFRTENSWYDHIEFAFFSSPTHFRVRVHMPENEKDPGSEPMILEFRLQNFAWQLTRVRMPVEIGAN